MTAVNQDEVFYLHIWKDSEFLTGMDKINGVVFDANKNKIMDIEFVDNGDRSKGDGKAMDGFYTTIARFPKEGLYTIEVVLDAKDIPLRVTKLAMMPPMGGFTRSEALQDPFNATFNRTASLSVWADSTVEALPIPRGIPNFPFRDEEVDVKSEDNK